MTELQEAMPCRVCQLASHNPNITDENLSLTNSTRRRKLMMNHALSAREIEYHFAGHIPPKTLVVLSGPIQPIVRFSLRRSGRLSDKWRPDESVASQMLYDLLVSMDEMWDEACHIKNKAARVGAMIRASHIRFTLVQMAIKMVAFHRETQRAEGSAPRPRDTIALLKKIITSHPELVKKYVDNASKDVSVRGSDSSKATTETMEAPGHAL